MAFTPKWLVSIHAQDTAVSSQVLERVVLSARDRSHRPSAAGTKVKGQAGDTADSEKKISPEVHAQTQHVIDDDIQINNPVDQPPDGVVENKL